MSWDAFYQADDQIGFDAAPKGTIAEVGVTIKTGGHDDATRGWTGAWFTSGHMTGLVDLNGKFVALERQYACHKVWSLIRLRIPKRPDWVSIGCTFAKGALNFRAGRI